MSKANDKSISTFISTNHFRPLLLPFYVIIDFSYQIDLLFRIKKLEEGGVLSPLAAGSPKITENKSIRALSPEAKRCKREISSDEAAKTNDIIERVNRILGMTQIKN